MSEHFCGTCNRLRVTADGNLKVEFYTLLWAELTVQMLSWNCFDSHWLVYTFHVLRIRYGKTGAWVVIFVKICLFCLLWSIMYRELFSIHVDQIMCLLDVWFNIRCFWEWAAGMVQIWQFGTCRLLYFLSYTCLCCKESFVSPAVNSSGAKKGNTRQGASQVRQNKKVSLQMLFVRSVSTAMQRCHCGTPCVVVCLRKNCWRWLVLLSNARKNNMQVHKYTVLKSFGDRECVWYDGQGNYFPLSFFEWIVDTSPTPATREWIVQWSLCYFVSKQIKNSPSNKQKRFTFDMKTV